MGCELKIGCALDQFFGHSFFDRSYAFQQLFTRWVMIIDIFYVNKYGIAQKCVSIFNLFIVFIEFCGDKEVEALAPTNVTCLICTIMRILFWNFCCWRLFCFEIIVAFVFCFEILQKWGRRLRNRGNCWDCTL